MQRATVEHDAPGIDDPPRLRAIDLALIAAGVVLGALIRAPGFTRFDLWFDDAWAAMPAKVPLSTAVHMVVTTPLYTLAMREWIRLGPAGSWWAQLPAFVLGLLGIAAIYLLARFFLFSRPLAGVLMVLIAVGPITSTYSLRVKEYSADLLLSCLLLWLAERWRRSPNGRGVAWLTAVAALSLAISASTIVTVAGVVVVLLWQALLERPLRRQVATSIGALLASAAVLWAVWLRHIPPSLTINQSDHGFLVDYRSVHLLSFSLQTISSGFLHGLAGMPTSLIFSEVHPWLTVTTALVDLVVVGAALVLVAVEIVKGRGRTISPFAAAFASVVTMVVLCAADRVPLGAGRTDEVLYPATLLLLAHGWVALVHRIRRARLEPDAEPMERARRLPVAAALLVACLLAGYGLAHRVVYPEINLNGLVAKLRPELRPGDVIVVDGAASFPWGYAGLSPTAVSVSTHGIPWPQGFHLVSLDPTVVLSQSYLQPDAQIAALAHRTRTIWFIGATIGTAYSTAAPRAIWDYPLPSTTNAALGADGWRPSTLQLHVVGAYAAGYAHP